MSVRSVVRIWAEERCSDEVEQMLDDAEKIAEALKAGVHWHGTTPELVQLQVICQYDSIREQRAYYMAMQEANPTYAQWGNLVMKCNQQMNELLRMQGNWFGLEKQGEPLSWIGVRNRDHDDELDEVREKMTAAYIKKYRRDNNIPDDVQLTVKETLAAIEHMPARTPRIGLDQLYED